MNIVANVLSIVLILVLVGAASADFRLAPAVVAACAKIKVPKERIKLLGCIKLLAAAGLAVGFASSSLATLTGFCLVAYFAIATATHARVKDTIKNTFPAFMLMVLSMVMALASAAR